MLFNLEELPMKRIAALSLVAALAATGASAENATVKADKPTVSTQAGLALSGMAPAAAVVGLAVIATAIAAADASSGT
jgi:hypothetical protein